MKRYVMLFAPALVLTLGACDSGEPGEVADLEAIGAVEVSSVVTSGTGSQVPGRVVALKTANIATRGSGTVEAVPVDVGSVVRAGQVVARLEGAGVESAVASAEAQAVVARRTYERMVNLERDGAATRQELDQAEANLKMAEARLEEASAARDYIVLRAPFDGTVTARMADPGDLAVPGKPILVISGSGGVKVAADAPASMVDRVEEGKSVVVVWPETGARWVATVRRVVPVIDLASHRFRIEATFDSSDRLPAPGSFVRLDLPVPGESSYWIPADAVVRRGQLTGAFVISGEQARLRWIRTGRRTGDAVEALAGITEADLVVRRPPEGLVDGAVVESSEIVPWALAEEGGR
jgi:RND family efflux transporter MFP subunit